jgi:hypothetical protein
MWPQWEIPANQRLIWTLTAKMEYNGNRTTFSKAKQKINQ